MSQDQAIAIRQQATGSAGPDVISMSFISSDNIDLHILPFGRNSQVPLKAGAGGFSSWEPLLYPKIEKVKAQALSYQRFIDLNFSLAIAGSAGSRSN